jgi:uncharacterized protein YjbI with pentapeptide repeats
MVCWLGRLLIGFLSMALVLLVLWAVVIVPPLLIDTSGIQDPAKRLDEVNGLRTTLAGVLGGLAVIAGAVVGALNLRETQCQNRAIQEQNRALLDLQHRGQVTERFTRAIEQLGRQGPEQLDVRLGAVYALEQIAQDSDELHWPIMEVLTAYLREHAPVASDLPVPNQPALDATVASTPMGSDAPTKEAPADHQAIATVIGRRRWLLDPPGQGLDLHQTYLVGYGWEGVHLEGADLRGADLGRAKLHQAHLEGANLRAAHLEGADLRDAHLERAILHQAHLEGANLFKAYLKRALLTFAHLEQAHLREAHLEEAALSVVYLRSTTGDHRRTELQESVAPTGAHLEGADLRGAHLEGSWLIGVRLDDADLSGAHLDGAHLEEAHLDTTFGLTREQLECAAGLCGARLPGELAEQQLSLAPDLLASGSSEPLPGQPAGR